MSDDLVCWKCGASLEDLPQPLGRRAECPACGAELHVCRLCRHYDTAKAKQCRELAADEIKNKTRANFCEWFQARAGAYSGATTANGGRSDLEELFGGFAAIDSVADAKSELDKLFGKG
jgi:ribosome-binding protein aMBF1 (putative translation factor)